MKPFGGVLGGDMVSYSRVYKSSIKSKKTKHYGTSIESCKQQ